MRIALRHITIVIISIFLISCSKENNPCLKSTGKRKQETRILDLNNIHRIQLKKNINLSIIQDSSGTVEIDAGENLIDFIRTDVKNGVLEITNDNKCNFLRSFKKDINVTLHIPHFDSVDVYGSGDLTFLSRFKADRLTFNMHEFTGDIHADVDCSERVRFNAHQAAANVYCKGFARYSILYNSGTGWFYTDELESIFLQVNSKSTGDCFVGDSKVMYVLIQSSGSINYQGNPDEIQIWDDSGSGALIKAI